MNLLDLMVKIGVDDDASAKIGKISNGIKSNLGRAAKAGAVAMGAAVAATGVGLAAMGKQALDSYAQYEQLVGGVDKLFGSASGKLQEYAANAYQTAGMSANQYMEQATSFSAALINSLGGDVDKAAEMSDVAMRAMSDNVNVFGSNMGDVQNAFQGFAKQNYTMLDNLKLGYGGTKSEMQRLIDDANAYAEANGLAADLSIDSFADIVQAIEYVQEAQGIAGTTAEEAAKTIEGSVNMARAAWQNWLTSLGDENADLEETTNQLVESIITAGRNIIPRLGEIFGALGTAAAEYLPGAAQEIADALAAELYNALPQAMQQAIADSFGSIDFGVISADFSSIAAAFEPALQALRRIGSEVMPLIGPAFELLGSVAQDTVVPALERLGEAASYFMEQLEPWVPHIMNVGVILGEVFVTAVAAVIDIIAAAVNILGTVLDALMAIPEGIEAASKAFSDLDDAIVQGLTEGISLDAVIGAFMDLVDGIINAVKGALGIASPSTVFMEIGQNIIAGLAEGVTSGVDAVLSVLEGIATSIVDSFSGVASGIGGFFADVPGTVQGAWDTLTGAASSVPGAVAGFFSGVGNTLGGLFAPLPTVAGGFFSTLQTAASGVPGAVSGFFNGIGGRISNFFAEVPDTVSNFFNSLASRVSSVPGRIVGFFNGIAGRVSSTFQSIPGTVSGVFNRLVSSVTSIPGRIVSFFRGLGGRISSAIGGIHFPQPHVSWGSASKGGLSLPLPHVSWYAEGGLFPANNPTLVGFGDNKKYDELAMPLSPKVLAQVGAGIAQNMQPISGGDTHVTNIYVNGAKVNDDAAIESAFLEFMSLLSRKAAMNVG